MSEDVTERIELRVPVNCGHLIGNTLRQFAMRGSNTWQIAAYNLPMREGSFGFGGGYSFSYLDLLKGKLICPHEDAKDDVMVKKFQRQGDKFVCDDMTIVGLEHIDVSGLECCLVYANGSRTAAQNSMAAKEQFADNCVAVPSKHTEAIVFKYSVEPYDKNTETIVLDATPGCVKSARQAAVTLLQALQI